MSGCSSEKLEALNVVKDALFARSSFPSARPENNISCGDLHVHFCRKEICQSFVYDRETKRLALAVEAGTNYRIGIDHNVIGELLKPIFDHKYTNRYNVLLLTTATGQITVTVGFDGLLMITAHPR
jgi:hypothetical protein